MISWLIESSLRFRRMVIAAATAAMVVGLTQLPSAKVDVLPEFSPPYVEIQTEALGLSAAEVEQFITVPLEANLLAGVAFVDTMRSESVPGLSSIVLVFEPGTDLMRARQLVQERLTQAHTLPNVSRPPQMIQPLSSTSRVMMIGLSSQEHSLIQLSVLARWTVRPRLMGVPGVANVAIWGHREQQLQVLVEPTRLHARGVTLQQVINTTGNALWVSPLSYLNASTPGSGGFMDTPNQRLNVRHVLPIRTPEDLSRVSIEGATDLRLGDVATVREDHQPMIGDASTDQGQALLLVVEKLPGSNTLEVTRGIESALEAMKPGLEGVVIDSSLYRPATFVESAIGNLGLMLIVALAFVALVVGAFLRQWRTTVVAVVAVTTSLLIAALILHLVGATINAMVVAGLVVALAVVVDDAIIDVENALRRLRETGADGEARSLRTVLVASAAEARHSIVYATLIILLVVVPVLAVDGITGSFLRPLAASFALAVVISMVVALTITPALSALLLGNGSVNARKPAVIRSPQRGYRKILAWSLRRPATAPMLAGLLVLGAIAILPQLAGSVTPAFQERDLLIKVEGAPGTSQPAMNRITTQATAELRAIPGVRRVGVHIGRALTSDQVTNVNSAQLWVSIDPAADYGSTLTAVRSAVEGYPGLRLEVDTYLNDLAGEIAGTPAEPVSVRLFGPDLTMLREQAEVVRTAIAGVAGVIAPRVVTTPEEPTIEVEVDLAAAYRHGVKPGDVRRAATTLIAGLEVGNLFEDQKVFEVIVVGVPQTRHSLTAIEGILVDTPSGAQVPLGELAEVKIAPSPVAIGRSGVSRYIDIVAAIEDRDGAAVLTDVRQALAGLAFPNEYHAELSTAATDQQAQLQRLLGVLFAVAIGVFLLIQAAVGSWRLAAVALLAMPFALVGGVFAAWLTGGGLSLGSAIGFLAVLTIAARNQLALVAHLQRLQHNGMPFGPGLVLRGAQERSGPILMTAVVTALAFVPVLLLGERPGLELLRPMAIVVLGGLVTSTLLNLFVVPTLYLGLPGGALARDVIDIQLPRPSDPQTAGAR